MDARVHGSAKTFNWRRGNDVNPSKFLAFWLDFYLLTTSFSTCVFILGSLENTVYVVV